MEYRQLGNSGLKVPVLSFGTATFSGGIGEGSWGETQVDEASRLVDIALDADVNFFDTSDVHSDQIVTALQQPRKLRTTVWAIWPMPHSG